MHNFIYHNPVKVYFGEGQISALSQLVAEGSKVLITYGGGSIKTNGVLNQVEAALNHCQVFHFGGIEPNPEYATLQHAVAMCKAEQIDLILAVGGGSVIDGSKFIALAAHYPGDGWDILSQTNLNYTSAIKLGVVQTLPATGSEMNSFAVISRREENLKLGFGHPLVYPEFTILDPLTTYSLPKRQLLNGIVDPFIHVTEQYLTTDLNCAIQDGFAETILKTLIKVGPAIANGSTDYSLRANWMWAATNALNGLIGVGVDHDWATHMIGHELTAAYNLDHAQTLAIVAPQLWRQQKEFKLAKLVKLAKNVWQLPIDDPTAAAEAAIQATEHFFQRLGVKTRFSDYDLTVDAELISHNVFRYQPNLLGERKNIDASAVKQILAQAC
jgi:NADP-dependent alcohol dehydrogenase